MANLEHWMDAAAAAAEDVASQALGLESSTSVGESAAPTGFGAFVALSGGDDKVQVGVMLDQAGGEALARALLGMPEDEAFASEGDLADAFGEIVNMVAGGVKTRMNEQVPGIQLGLPLCVKSLISPAHVIQSSRQLMIGSVRALVIVLSHSGSLPRSVARHAAE
jgi:CheY-specific phosphatase CheX